MYKTTPNSIYKMVQVGAKTQLGGVSDGLVRPWYHVCILLAVKNPAISPTDKVTQIESGNNK